MITVHIEAAGTEQLKDILRGLGSLAGGVVPQSVSVPTTESTPAPKKTQKTAEAPKSAPAADAPASTPTLEDVQTMIAKVNKAKGREAIVALLGKFNAKRGQELKATDYAAFMVEAKKQLGE